jgi:hypothetical protein
MASLVARWWTLLEYLCLLAAIIGFGVKHLGRKKLFLISVVFDNQFQISGCK